MFGIIVKIMLNSEQTEQFLNDLANRIVSDTPPQLDIAAIGIRSRGKILAQRLSIY